MYSVTNIRLPDAVKFEAKRRRRLPGLVNLDVTKCADGEPHNRVALVRADFAAEKQLRDILRIEWQIGVTGIFFRASSQNQAPLSFAGPCSRFRHDEAFPNFRAVCDGWESQRDINPFFPRVERRHAVRIEDTLCNTEGNSFVCRAVQLKRDAFVTIGIVRPQKHIVVLFADAKQAIVRHAFLPLFAAT